MCKIESAYFVVWTEKDLHIEQIMFDEILWNTICEKSKHIFVTAILPELVGKFYARLPFSNKPLPLCCTSDNAKLNKDSVKLNKVQEDIWCFCAQVESGKIIFCDNEECPIGWFHYLCIGISCAPRAKWYCPDCRKTCQVSVQTGQKNFIKLTEFYDIHVVETFLKLAIRIVFLIKVGSLTCKILNEKYKSQL